MHTTFMLFAKPPVAGQSKTRLAQGVGPTRAAQLAAAFIVDSWATLNTFVDARCVCSSTVNSTEALGLANNATVWEQRPGDLGARLDEAFTRALKSSSAAVAFGADSPGLPKHLIAAATRALITHDAVIGPTSDGGFYLIGLKTHRAPLFNNLPWSQPHTCEATLSRLEARGLSVFTLPSWWDVDEAEDLNTLREHLREHPNLAPKTAQLLQEI